MRPIAGGRKTRLIYGAAGALVLAVPATAVALTAGPLSSPKGAAHAAPSSAPTAVTVRHRAVRTAAQRGCAKLFTVNMGEGAANLIYSGTGTVTEHDLQVLGYIERCQRNPAAQGFVRGYDRHQAQVHDARVAAAHAAAEQAAQAQAAQPQQGQTSGDTPSGSSAPSQAQQGSSSASSSQQSGGSGGWAIPSSVVQCESGGQNLAPNSAGASGYYQIIPSTWQAYGGSQYAPSAYQATPQQQAAVASRIWNSAGASAWVCAGGQ